MNEAQKIAQFENKKEHAAGFIMECTSFDETSCTLAYNVYEAYKSYFFRNLCDSAFFMDYNEFLIFVKKYYSKYCLESMASAARKELALYFANMRLSQKKEAVTKAPCHSCAENECENCPTNPVNGDSTKLYTPEEAVQAMLAGKTLKNKKGWLFYWGDDKFSFHDEEGELHHIWDFSGLYSDPEKD